MEVIGVKFDKSPKVYYFAAEEGVDYKVGAVVVTETARGIEPARIVMGRTDVTADKVVQPLKPILRFATDEDLKKIEQNAEKRSEALATVREKVAKSGLKMKVIDVEFTLDGLKLIVYFTAESRVDFRELVRDLAGIFRLRIELRQVGARDECRMKGGVAPCGRACCCSDYISDFAHVTIKMAKNQSLSLNPGKISGLCGRLMCCLSYENDFYAEVNKKMPKLGSVVHLADGREGICVSINQLKETVRVKIDVNDAIEFADVSLKEIAKKGGGALADDIDADKIDDELKDLID
ncbi:MAG: stage 0 sporulation family protein [Clostridia bacterium]|nr:stage 0 sporulation family protein [Clostridia bacterium]